MTGFLKGIRGVYVTRRGGGLGGEVDLSSCNGRRSSFVEAFI